MHIDCIESKKGIILYADYLNDTHTISNIVWIYSVYNNNIEKYR